MSKKWYYFYVLLFFLLLVFVGVSAFGAEKQVTYQTLPNSTVRDYRAPAIVSKEQNGKVIIYQTMPGSAVRDYSAPAYVVKKK